MKKLSFFLTSILYIFIAHIFIVSPASAADYGLSISPPLLRIHIKPGKSITQVFKIENLSKSEKTLITRVVPFTKADTNGNPVIDPRTTADWLGYFSLANSNIKFDQPFTVAAGSSEQLILSLTVPETAPLMDIYATLIVSTYQNNIDTNLQGTSVSATIGSNMLITISTTAFPDTVLKIADFTPQKGALIKIGNLYFADSITPLTFTASVINEGKFLSETKGVFRVTTSQGTPVYLEGILPVNVIGKSQRQLLNTNGKSFSFTPSLGQIGPHQVTLEIKTDNSNTSNSINIFFFPFKISLGLIVAILTIITIIKITTTTTKDSIDNKQLKMS